MATKRPRSYSLASDHESDDEVIDLTGYNRLAAAAPHVRAPIAAESRQSHPVAAAPDTGPSPPSTYRVKFAALDCVRWIATWLRRRRLAAVRCVPF
jgi:hypothetical protein